MRKLLFILILVISACSQADITKMVFEDYTVEDTDNIKMSSFVKLEKLIPLETNSSCLIGNILQLIKKNGFYYVNSSNSPVMVFDGDGKFVRTIGGFGHGEGEYSTALSIDVDEENVYVLSNSELLTYSLDGQFEKSNKLDINADALHVCENGNIIFFVLGNKMVLHAYDKKLNPVNDFLSHSQVLRLSRQMPFHAFGGEIFFHEGHSTDLAIYNPNHDRFTAARIFDDGNCLSVEDEEDLIAQGEKPYKSSKRIFEGLNTSAHQLFIASMFDNKTSLFVKDNNTGKTKCFNMMGMTNDLTFTRVETFFAGNTGSPENFITYISPELLLEAKSQKADIIGESPYKDKILQLVENLDSDSNPVIVEYSFSL